MQYCVACANYGVRLPLVRVVQRIRQILVLSEVRSSLLSTFLRVSASPGYVCLGQYQYIHAYGIFVYEKRGRCNLPPAFLA